jgi:2-amino-4-hydroxy-6-hydroxymethyldihydropteridine diphosphokinase
VDIDILFVGDAVLVRPNLEIPHPRLAERAFVLRPLAEIVPGFRHPGLGRTVAELAAALPEGDGGVVRLPAPRPSDWLKAGASFSSPPPGPIR